VTTLVSNAGVPAMSRGDLLDMTTESFDRASTSTCAARSF
jgi:hypothetical protein